MTLCTFICPGVVRCILYKVSPLMDLSHTWIKRKHNPISNIATYDGMISPFLKINYT